MIIMNLEIDGYLKDLKIIKTNGMILCCKYSDDRKLMLAGFMDGRVNLYSGKTDNLEITLSDEDTDNINNAVTGLTHRNDPVTNTVTASYSDGFIKKWDYHTRQCIYTIKEDRQTLGLSYHPKVEKLFSLGDDGKILMYDEETQKIQQIYEASEEQVADGHSSRVFSICFNPANQNEFITGGWDATVQFWDVRQSNSTRYINDIFIGGTDALAINNAGTEFLSCAWRRDDPMQLWDYSTAQLIRNVTPDTNISQLYCGKYINEKFIATGGCNSHMCRIVDMTSYSTATSIIALPGGVYTVDFKSPVSSTKHAQNVLKLEDVTELPNVLFCSAKNLYEIRFK